MKKIVFVCTGNTCRSPMAEGIANNLLGHKYQSVSCGLSASSGDPASENAVTAMKEIGVDISSHRSRQLTIYDIESADIIVAISNSHFNYLSQIAEAKDKLLLLGNGISDPYMQDLDVYRKCRDEIKLAIANMFLDLEISQMTTYDVSDLAKIEAETFGKSAWSEKGIAEELNNPCAHFIVARSDNKVLGYTGFQLLAGEAYIANIVVKKEYRGLGIGKRLLATLIDLAKELKSVFISLEVRQSNSTAKKMYENFGFEKVGERKNFYVDPKEDADIYTLYF